MRQPPLFVHASESELRHAASMETKSRTVLASGLPLNKLLIPATPDPPQS